MRFKSRVTSTETIRVTANTVAKCMSNLLIICQFPYRIDRVTAKSGLTWRRDKGHRTMAPGLMRFQLDLGARPHSLRAELGGTPITARNAKDTGVSTATGRSGSISIRLARASPE